MGARADDPVPAVAGLAREAGIALLDRAADVGLLTAYGDGYYAVHPAIPWHLHTLFTQHYGPDGSPPALHAARAWTTATSTSATTTTTSTSEGHTEVTGVLEAEEANLLHARRLALTHHWHDLIIGAMQGLHILYEHTGRAIEWRRLVDELVPELTDPDTGGPRPGREEQWAMLTSYRVRIAQDARDWPPPGNSRTPSSPGTASGPPPRSTSPPANSTTGSAPRSSASRRPWAISARSCGNKTIPAACSPTRKPWTCSSGSATGAPKPPPRSTSGTPTRTSPPCATSTRPSTGTSATSSCSTSTTPSAVHRARDSATSPTSASKTPGPPGHPRAAPPAPQRAAGAYQQALGLLPDNAVDELAVTHHALGNIYGAAGDIATALGHYQKAIHYRERQDDRYGAGWARHAAAITLAQAGRRHDALLYARAALRDYEAVGPGAAARAGEARQLITLLEQEPPDDHDPNPAAPPDLTCPHPGQRHWTPVADRARGFRLGRDV